MFIINIIETIVFIDVNECIMNFNESGSGFSENSNIDQSDEEPEVCDYNAHCYNTIGSYYCVCDEGYVMIKDKCEFNPPGSGSNQLRFGSTSSPATFPPKDYGYLNTIVSNSIHSLFHWELQVGKFLKKENKKYFRKNRK